MTIEIVEYLDGKGRSPFAKWFDDLPATAAAKVAVALDRIGRGLLGDVKSVGSGVSERRIDFGPGDRAISMDRLQGSATKRRAIVALTKSFKDTVRARAQRDPDFRLALIREAVEKLVDGDVESGLSILGDYVNATVGYKTLAERTGKNPKSLMRMLGPAGNPTAENLFSVIVQLKEQEGLEFDIRARHA
jgi:putative addiction module killer protein